MKEENKILQSKHKSLIIHGVEITPNMTLYDFMAKLELPQRGPRGDPANIKRIMMHQDALREFGESWAKRREINNERK